MSDSLTKQLVSTNIHFELVKANYLPNYKEQDMVPLKLSEPGRREHIKKVGGKPDTRQHLENLGFVPGADVTLITKLGENVIVRIKESRIAISQEMAGKIMV
jgi:ferrous iron transport protein A